MPKRCGVNPEQSGLVGQDISRQPKTQEKFVLIFSS